MEPIDKRDLDVFVTVISFMIPIVMTLLAYYLYRMTSNMHEAMIWDEDHGNRPKVED